MKQKGLVGALTLGMLLLAFSMMVPGTSQAISSKDLASIHGGACKAVCKSSTACAGDANGCVGNCKGASSGALCGTEGITNETNWYCGAPIEDGGGCNLGGSTSGKKAFQCTCDGGGYCGRANTSMVCNYNSTCSVDK